MTSQCKIDSDIAKEHEQWHLGFRMRQSLQGGVWTGQPRPQPSDPTRLLATGVAPGALKSMEKSIILQL